MKRANEAVEQRDYRLALNNALDARERAQNAAKQAADGKAVARTEAEHALGMTTSALNDAHVRLRSAEKGHAPGHARAQQRNIQKTGMIGRDEQSTVPWNMLRSGAASAKARPSDGSAYDPYGPVQQSIHGLIGIAATIRSTTSSTPSADVSMMMASPAGVNGATVRDRSR